MHHEEQKPSRFLTDNIDLLPKGRALDLAMGEGRNAIFLASKGFQVDGVDSSSEAVEIALERARLSGVDIKTYIIDLEKNSFIKKDSYDVIICFKYLQRSLFPVIKKGLREGGVIVYETYITDQKRFGRPKNPDHLLKYNELINAFRDLRCLRYFEGIVENRKAVASLIAKKEKI